jgi:lantibiotic modifying enzyme
MKERKFRSCIDYSSRERINKLIDHIAESLVKISFVGHDFGILGGSSGVSIFLAYYLQLRNTDAHAYIIAENVNQSFCYLESNSEFDWNYGTGLSGLIYSTNHLINIGFFEDPKKEVINGVDLYLKKIMCYELWSGNYDFFMGAIGYCLTLCNLLSSYPVQIRESLLDFVGILYKKRKKLNKHVSGWQTIIDETNGSVVHGFDLGMAHGMASILSILAKLYNLSINKKKVELMTAPLVNLILDAKTSSMTLYPNKSDLSLNFYKMKHSRLAWCYGDLGISVALWHASQALGRKDWEQEAIDTILHASKRRGLVENGVVDAGLCHGTAGIAHIFNRMYGYTGLEELKEASNYWFAETLKMARFEDGLAGFKAWQGNERGWVNEPGLLEGIAGIGLALISAVSDIEPAWDECLLLS